MKTLRLRDSGLVNVGKNLLGTSVLEVRQGGVNVSVLLSEDEVKNLIKHLKQTLEKGI